MSHFFNQSNLIKKEPMSQAQGVHRQPNQLRTTNNQHNWSPTPKLKATKNKEKRQKDNGLTKTAAELRNQQ
jgi:hypothetical protein